MKYLILILIIVTVISCSLKKNNPVDPDLTGIETPSRIYNIDITKIGDSYVKIEWDTLSYQNGGYFIYRSENTFGYFLKIGTIPSISINNYDDIPENLSENRYWYKISAFKIIADQDTLEGYRSDAKTW